MHTFTKRLKNSAFTLLELVIAVAIMGILMVGIMEATAGTTSLSEDVKIRADLRQQAQHIVVDLAEALFDADILVWNTDATSGDEDAGFDYVAYQETTEIFPEIKKSDPIKVSLASIQQTFPSVADKYIEETDELDMIPNGVDGLDKTDLPGFFVIFHESMGVVFIGVTVQDTIRGITYTESYMIFNKFNGTLTPR